MPSYRSFHFDAYYNSFTQTWEESQQPITPTCIQFTSALPETLTPPCPSLHWTTFFFYLFYQMKEEKVEKYLKSRENCICKRLSFLLRLYSDSLDQMYKCRWWYFWKYKHPVLQYFQYHNPGEITLWENERWGTNKLKGPSWEEPHCLQYFCILTFFRLTTVKCCYWLETAPQLQHFVHAGDGERLSKSSSLFTGYIQTIGHLLVSYW